MHKIRKMLKDDIKPLIKILKKTKVFKQNEIIVAKELMEIFVRNKNQKDYHIYVSEQKGRITGYVCFGPTPCTDKRFDLYWIAVDPDFHGQGLGSRLLLYAEIKIKSLGGRMVIIETSSTKRYTNTRKFYFARKYKLGAIIKDFYSENDHKMVFIKRIKCSEKKVLCMEKWKRMLLDCVSAEEISKRFDIPLEMLRNLSEKLGMRITRYYYSLIKEKNDPIYKQVIPDEKETEKCNLMKDPLAEDKDSPVRSIVHRYPDRCLFLVSPYCASYCRFCTRSRKVGDPQKINLSFIGEGLDYIKSHKEIWDVIVSGGDPLMLDGDLIDKILSSLRSIEHLQIIRIGTRMPCFLPQRITGKLVKMLRKYLPLYVNVHFNHPRELTKEACTALNKLANAGIPLGNQSVLLKGVNDDSQTMKELLHKLLLARVRPYYIYQADMVEGTEHLRTTVQKGVEIIKSLRGWTSGLAVPHFVIDAPNGGGKIPILPNYMQKIDENEVTLENYEGKKFRYVQPYTQKNEMKKFKETCKNVFESNFGTGTNSDKELKIKTLNKNHQNELSLANFKTEY